MSRTLVFSHQGNIDLKRANRLAFINRGKQPRWPFCLAPLLLLRFPPRQKKGIEMKETHKKLATSLAFLAAFIAVYNLTSSLRLSCKTSGRLSVACGIGVDLIKESASTGGMRDHQEQKQVLATPHLFPPFLSTCWCLNLCPS